MTNATNRGSGVSVDQPRFTEDEVTIRVEAGGDPGDFPPDYDIVAIEGDEAFDYFILRRRHEA